MTADAEARRIEVHADGEAFADAAAVTVLSLASAAVRARGVFHVALAGGSTPHALYGALLARGLASSPHVAAWDVWFGDERCVPADDSDSNFGMADRTFLSTIRARPSVHRVPTELRAPSEVAAAYEAELSRAFGLAPGGVPVFDLVLLGLGADGHTASLFPGDAALAERRRLVVAVRGPKAPADRVTFTLPVLCAARAVLFVVAGETKARALRAIAVDGADLPAARVLPVNGTLTFLADRSAASLLGQGA